MNNESIEKLRIDRRLQGRRGWISEEEIQKDIDALPDVSSKILSAEEDPERSAPAEGAAPAPAATQGAPDSSEGGGA